MTADRAAVVTVPALMPVRTVAEILGCSTRTVRRRVAEGAFPGVVEHGRLMVRADDLRAYIDTLARYGPAPQRARPVRRHHIDLLSE